MCNWPWPLLLLIADRTFSAACASAVSARARLLSPSRLRESECLPASACDDVVDCLLTSQFACCMYAPGFVFGRGSARALLCEVRAVEATGGITNEPMR